MGLGWLVFLLFTVGSKATENMQAPVSQKCKEDTNTLLWENTQDRPYAVQIGCFSFLFTGCNRAQQNTQASTVSQKCAEDTNTFLGHITQDSPKEYAVLMYDAFGKMGSNVKGGNVNQPGLLQQCRSAHGPTFSGQYCKVFLKQGTVQYFVGICVPDSCGQEDVKMLVLDGRLRFGQTPLIPPFPRILVNHSTQEMLMTHCLSDTIAPGASDAMCLFVCFVMLAIPLAATLLTAMNLLQGKKEVAPTVKPSSSETKSNTSEEASSTTNTSLSFPQGFLYRCIQAFSIHNTSQGVLSTSSSAPGGGYSSLNGIRVLSVLWIISGHSAMVPGINNIDNYKHWRTTVENHPLHIPIFSGPYFLSVDTFLVLGGLLSAKSLLGIIDRAKDKLTLSLVASFLFKRIKRIQPLHIFVMCLTAGLNSLIQWGPYWFPEFHKLLDCKRYWWANILLVSNFFPVSETCIPWSWYLSLDFQCYATTPLLIFFYRLNKRVFVVVAGGLLLLNSVAGAVVTAQLQLPVFVPPIMASDLYHVYYYIKPYTRYGPFLIGILTGIYLKTKKGPLIKHKWQAALGWIFSLSMTAALIGVSYILKETPASPSVPHALFQGLHRPLWALVVTWIILACEDGYGGVINSFLSLGFWVPLSNISFACYLTHPIFMIFYIGMQETAIHYTEITYLYLFLGHLMLTIVSSYLFTLLVEKPFLLLKWRGK
ncbi:O-acyltransferase like protein-like [Eleginops maclovinus]|uniref:O-acyltransferase like protein-like n=1 Tax=Eleginops maclovinus TaxID=56733 RepID=UPI003080912D